jgi:hypothetical protein
VQGRGHRQSSVGTAAQASLLPALTRRAAARADAVPPEVVSAEALAAVLAASEALACCSAGVHALSDRVAAAAVELQRQVASRVVLEAAKHSYALWDGEGSSYWQQQCTVQQAVARLDSEQQYTT